VNVAESHVLSLQAPERVEGILSASSDQRLTTADTCSCHTEVPEEKLVQSWALLKAPVEFVKLPSEGFTQILIVAGQRSLSRIWEDCDGSLTEFEEVRIGAKVDGVLPANSSKDVKITLKLSAVISCDQDYGRMGGHPDQHVYPEIPFFNRGLVSRKIAIDDEEVCVGAD
jgi:hypothetical protein